MSVRSLSLFVTAGLAAFAQAGTAQASNLALNCTEYASSDVPANCTSGAVATMLATPGAYAYSDTALLPASSSGGIISGSTYPSGYSGASFYDAFVITIGNSQGASIASTINESSTYDITNFEERLYAYTGTAPTVGAVPTAIDFWTLPAGSSGTVAVLPTTTLSAGTYVLEVRGDVTGTSGGAYSGTFELSPVPLPAALWLLVSGLGGLGGVFGRRSEHALPA